MTAQQLDPIRTRIKIIREELNQLERYLDYLSKVEEERSRISAVPNEIYGNDLY